MHISISNRQPLYAPLVVKTLDIKSGLGAAAMRCVVVCIQAGEGKLKLFCTGSIDRLASFVFQATSLKTGALDCTQIMSACSIAQLQTGN